MLSICQCLLIVIPLAAGSARPADAPATRPSTGPGTRPATRLTIDNVAPATGPDFPAGLLRIDYTSSAGNFKDWALVLPSKEPTWIVMIHGHGSTGDQLFTRPDIRDLWLPILRPGHGILTVNLRGNAWMSPDAAADLQALLAEVRARYHARRFVFASGSMGGTSNLIYAVLHPEDVAGVVALCPASDLTTYHQWCMEHRSVPVIDEIRRAIEAGYNGPPQKQPAAYRAHSALARNARLTMPVYVVHAAGDTTIPVEQSRALAKAIGPRPTFHYQEIEGGHDAPLKHMHEALDWVLNQLK
jgi:pimeloyl-ACP methyl ester carboxylesterase